MAQDKDKNIPYFLCARMIKLRVYRPYKRNKSLLDQDPVLYRIDISPITKRDPGMKKKLNIGNMAEKIIN